MRWRAPLAVVLLWPVAVSAIGAMSGGKSVYGPETFQRGNGRPDEITRKFSVTNPSNPYTLRVTSHGVTDATISLNGQVVFGSDADAGEACDQREAFDRLTSHEQDALIVDEKFQPKVWPPR